MELWFNDFQNSTSLLVILEIIPGGDHAWPAWMSPTGHSSQQSMETGWAPPADSWSQGVCWSPYLLGAGSVKLGCLAQIPASWGPSVMYEACVRLDMLHGSEMQGPKEHELRRLHRNARAMIHWICGIKDRDKIPSAPLLQKLDIDRGHYISPSLSATQMVWPHTTGQVLYQIYHKISDSQH